MFVDFFSQRRVVAMELFEHELHVAIELGARVRGVLVDLHIRKLGAAAGTFLSLGDRWKLGLRTSGQLSLYVRFSYT